MAEGAAAATAAAGDRWAVALFDLEGNQASKILSVRAGDIVLVNPRKAKDWWPANLNGTVGFLPRGYLKLKPVGWSPEDLTSLSLVGRLSSSNNLADSGEATEATIKKTSSSATLTGDDEGWVTDVNKDEDDNDHDMVLAIAKFAFQAQNAKQLSFEEGQELLVRPSEHDKWWIAEIGEEAGFVPFNYVELLDSDEEEQGSDVESGSASDDDDGSMIDVGEDDLIVAHSAASKAEIRFHGMAKGPGTSNSSCSRDSNDEEDESTGFKGHAESQTGTDSESEGKDDDNASECRDGLGQEQRLQEAEEQERQLQQNGSIAVCQYDFVAREEGELSFCKGDFVWVTPVAESDWWSAQNDRGETGFVPCNYLKPVKMQNDLDGGSLGGPASAVTAAAALGSSSLPGLKSSHGVVPFGIGAQNLLFFRILLSEKHVQAHQVEEILQDRQAFQLRHCVDGEVIHDEADPEIQAFHLVVQGSVLVTVGKARVATVGSGQWFGEQLVLGGADRKLAATLSSCGNSKLLMLTTGALERAREKHAAFHAAFSRVAPFRSRPVLGSLAVLSKLPPKWINVLGTLFKLKQFAPNEVVYRAETAARELFVIVEGGAHVVEKNRLLGPGDVFGKDSFMRGTPRRSTVVVTDRLVALVLDSKDLSSFVENVPDAERAFQEFVWRKSAEALRRIPFFESVPHDKLETIATLCKYRVYAQGEVVVRAGEAGSDFFVIETGVVGVLVPRKKQRAVDQSRRYGSQGSVAAKRQAFASSKDDLEEIEDAAQRAGDAQSTTSIGQLEDDPGDDSRTPTLELGPNEYFGEIAVLHSELRSATVKVVRGPCRCLVLDGVAFREFLMDCPQVKRDIVEKLTKRLRRASMETRMNVKRSSRNLATIGGSSSSSSSSSSSLGLPAKPRLQRTSSTIDLHNESEEIEWITRSTESLAAIPKYERNVADQESIDALTVWHLIGRETVACQEIFNAWPIYIHPSSRPDLWGAITDVYIKLVGLGEHMSETTVKVSTQDTVAKVLDLGFHAAEKADMPMEADVAQAFFGFKVASQNDFLVYRDIPLRQYKVVAKNCLEGERNHLTFALVDLRNTPSSNGSGVHALAFLKRKSKLGRKETSAFAAYGSKRLGRFSTRTLSLDSDATLSEGASHSDSDPPLPAAPCQPVLAASERILDGDHLLDTDAEDLFLPGVPSMSPSDWSKTMIDVTRRVMEVKSSHEEVGRSKQAPIQGSWPLRVVVTGLKDGGYLLRQDGSLGPTFTLRAELVYAAEVLETKYVDPFVLEKGSCRLESKVWFERSLSALPLTTRICFTLLEATTRGGSARSNALIDPGFSAQSAAMLANSAAVAGGSLQVFDQLHMFRSGQHSVVLWPDTSAETKLWCNNSPNLPGHSRLVVELDEFLLPVYYQIEDPIRESPSDGLRAEDDDQGGQEDTELESMNAKPSVGLAELTSGSEGRPIWNAETNAAKDAENGDSEGRKDQTKGAKVHHRSRSTGMGFFNRLKWSTTSPLKPVRKRSVRKAGIPDGVSEACKKLLLKNPIEIYTSSRLELQPLWEERYKLTEVPEALGRVLFAVDWTDKAQRNEALAVVSRWQTLLPVQAMELLDCHHGDQRVREYAVRCLEPLSDDELSEFLIQLTQVLKYECFHESELARFLLRRAWQNPREIGTKLFWALRAEMHKPAFSLRFGLILRAYLDNSCEAHRQDLSQQSDVQEMLKEVADSVVSRKSLSKVERSAFARQKLAETNGKLPPSFQVCLNPKIVVKGLGVEGCKVMNSKKKPLWLKLQSVDPPQGGGEDYYVMFKSGDDLRQDQMTLQMLRFMNLIWLEEGLDLRMTLYGCISTGDQLGMIELVTQAETTAGIQKKKHKNLGALSSRSLREWLENSNAGGQAFQKVVDNFGRSCAAYCVATYVLGIGDRHSDNIMMKTDGCLFHIDFGHFLGHFKSKFGVKRERAPFVFTKEMAFVMGGKNDQAYRRFVQLCCQAYNILRRHGNDLINMFRLMIPAGMPELSCDEDIQYLCQKLCLDKSDEQAAEIFKREINNCLGDTYRRVDNLFHNIKTGS